jgi:DeoR/GlpR family transcriptional regulator of sugar metabolism
METLIPEIEARKILSTYAGSNNQLLEWKQRFEIQQVFKLTRTQADYVLKFHNVTPKVAKKYITIVSTFGEKLMEDKLLPKAPESIWCEKLLCESDKAYHIWGKILDSEKNHALWLPKAAVMQPEKKLNRIIDYSPYDNRPPMEHQKVAIEKLLANDKFILADDMGLGKFIVNSTPIYTPFGTKKIGDLKIGDEVIGSNGKSCNVIGVFPQGKKETYKITFNDGYTILAGDEHLWSVSSGNYGKNTKNERIKKSLVLSTKQMFEGGTIKIKGNGYNSKKEYIVDTFYKSPNGNNKWQIPIVQPIHFKNKNELPIDPYLLGLGLGDGSFIKKNIKFSLHKDDYDEIFNGFNLKENKPSENKRNGYINVGNSLFELNIEHTRSYNKFIPDIYKYSSIENRLSILQGLMDTDGHCMLSKNGSFTGTEFSTISEKLCDDVCEIVQTLGGIARKKSRRSFYKKDGKRVECNISYRVNIKLPAGMNPFRLKRKSDRYNEPKKYPTGRYITKIEKYGEDDCTCISVDSPDKLYVAEHCIVTHNTTSAVIGALESGAKKVLIVCPASLKINWQREIANYSDRRVLIVEGRKWGSTFDFYIINYDIIKNYHTTDKSEDSDDYKLLVNEKFELAIVDEAHYISNTTANRTRLLNDVLEQIPKVWLLTGTPMTSRPINYFNLLKIVESPLTLNWQSYVRRYCKGYQFSVGNRKVWNTSGASNLDELRERTKNIVLRRMKTDILDLPEKIITPVFLELTSRMYDEEMEEFLRISNDSKDKETLSVTINRLMKIRQLISYEKIPVTCELIDKCLDQGKKVIVFTNFTMTLDMLQEKYKKNSVVLDGRMSKERRQEAVDRFQNEDKVKVFISNIIAGGVGITLTAAEVVIMNDLSFVPAHHSQAEDRAYRYGQKNSVLVYYPIFENTVEKIIYNILQKKKGIIDQVMGDGEYSESFSKDLIKSLF